MGLVSAANPIMNGGNSVTSGFLGSATKTDLLVRQIVKALRREDFLGEDDCIIHARNGDDFFDDPQWGDFIDVLKGYVIIPVEEYSRLGK